MRRILLITFAALVVSLSSGCSRSYTFQLLLTVTNAETGEPIEGATVHLNTSPLGGFFGLLRFGEEFPGTGANGQLEREFSVSSGALPCWYLTIEKDGYEPTMINIKPDPFPYQSKRETVPLPVAVQLKPVAKKARAD
jgi:hypothetical protein